MTFVCRALRSEWEYTDEMRIIEYESVDVLGKRLQIGLLVSVVLHIALVYLLSSGVPTAPAREVSLEVSFINEPAPPPQKNSAQTQIVETPDLKESAPPVVETNLRSEKDTSVRQQQIRRGDHPAAGSAPQSPQSRTSNVARNSPADLKKPATKDAKPPAGQKISTLRLDRETLMEKFSSPAAPAKSLERISPDVNYRAFSRPAGTGAAFIGRSGSSDFLPNLPDGDITLLNTKAEQFAVFVRRVATQVFSLLRSTGWETLRASDINSMRDHVTVIAILDRSGRLVSVSISTPSGSTRFDETLLSAVKKGARDPNPPPEALAADGRFHFVFKSRSWSQLAHNARTGAPFERRWLLLATGLL